MNALDVLVHALNFVAPALGTALILALLSRVLFRQKGPPVSLMAQWLVGSLAGCVVLVLGLLVLGRDGKMLTYLALVLVLAGVQLMQLGHPDD